MNNTLLVVLMDSSIHGQSVAIDDRLRIVTQSEAQIWRHHLTVITRLDLVPDIEAVATIAIEAMHYGMAHNQIVRAIIDYLNTIGYMDAWYKNIA